MGSWAIKALNVLLLVGCCFVAAKVVTQIAADVIEPDGLAALPASRGDLGDGTQRAAAPSFILARNLFGAQLESEAQFAEEPDEPIERTKLPLRLLGTAAGTEETRSRAAIEDEKTRKHMVVATNDPIEGHRGVTVESIERTRVILDNNGRPEELLLNEEAAKNQRPTPRPARQARRQSRQNTVKDRLKDIAGEDGEGISKLLSQARISPFFEGGEILGMKVDAIKSGSVFESAGLQNGDVITEINGIVIDRQEATPAVLEELLNAESIQIAAQRGGAAIQLSADPAELLEQP